LDPTAIPIYGKFLRYNKINNESQQVIDTKIIECIFD